MAYTYKRTDGTIGIDTKTTFVGALGGQRVLGLQSFKTVFDDAEDLVKKEYADVSDGALANSRGRWYEWLIALGSTEFRNANPDANLIIPLPNITQFDCSKIYDKHTFGFIEDLRVKLLESSDVNLITSNPDYVIIDGTIPIKHPDITNPNITTKLIKDLDNIYNQLEHTCALNQILGYAAAKSSVRGDRRFQIPHEGSVMKALYRHVQTREWLIDAPGIKYYAMIGKFSPADADALKTVATHSIVDVGSKPESAVNNIFKVFSGRELNTALSEMLK